MLRLLLARIAGKPATLLAALLLLALMAGTALGAPGALTSLFEPAASPPTLISYQGFVKVSGNAYSGTGYFKFAVVDAASGNGATNYWANDGTASAEPSTAVALSVSGGLFTVMLGDTSLAGMTQAITQNVFTQTATYLRVWFSQTAGGPFQALDPNQRIGSAAYALRAERAEIAADAEQLGGVSAATYQNRLTTLESGTPWGNLSGVPAGFADNVDNDTTYAAGSNLTLTGNTFALGNDVSVNSLTSTSSVKIGGTNVTCDPTTAGTVRWSNATLALQVCDGNSWANVSSSNNHLAFRARLTASTSIVSTGFTPITFTVEDFDEAGAFSGSTFTTPAAGLYHFECHLLLSPGASGSYGIGIFLNGSVVAVSYHQIASAESRAASADVKVVAGSTVQCRVFWTGSGPLNIYSNSTGAGHVDNVFSGYRVD